MARSVGYGVIGLAMVLLGVLIVVPFLKSTFPQYYDSFTSSMDGFRNPADGCGGVTCPEGSFCQGGNCIPIHVGSGDVSA
jgi:hypothetical protein